ncbi:MAG: sulfatase-like hydrolase/transferase [Myxococcales bacterium]|nr:sulfatase-like hydrolase/transferase [Myxococcales bacterium]
MAGRPHIVLVFTDQWRADARSAVLTPHLERLCTDALDYTCCITNAALCRPARATLMTGQPVAVHGYGTNHAVPDPRMHPSHVRQLRDAGYRTVLVGKSHLTPGHGHLDDHVEILHAWGFEQAMDLPDAQQLHLRSAYSDWLTASTPADQFDKARRRRDYLAYADWHTPSDTAPWSLQPADQLDAFCARRAVQVIEGHDSDAPLYLQVNFPGPHPPFDAPSAYHDRVDPMEATLAPMAPLSATGPALPSRQTPRQHSAEELARMRAAYFAKVALVDEGLGEVVAALRRQDLLDTAWVIVTADHGELLGDHGLTRKVVPYEGALRVPLVVRPPGGTVARGVSQPVDLVALVASIRAIGGVGEAPGLLEAVERPVISEAMGLVTVRTATHKVVWDRRAEAYVGAFELEADPLEQRNRVAELDGLRDFDASMRLLLNL